MDQLRTSAARDALQPARNGAWRRPRHLARLGDWMRGALRASCREGLYVARPDRQVPASGDLRDRTDHRDRHCAVARLTHGSGRGQAHRWARPPARLRDVDLHDLRLAGLTDAASATGPAAPPLRPLLPDLGIAADSPE